MHLCDTKRKDRRASIAVLSVLMKIYALIDVCIMPNAKLKIREELTDGKA